MAVMGAPFVESVSEAWTASSHRTHRSPRDEFYRARRSTCQDRKGVALPEHGPSIVVFAIGGPIAREELPALCGRFRAAADGAREVVCDVGAVEADLVAVDALARVTLAARRLGCTVRLRHASDELLGLIAFVGLDEVVG